MEKFDHSTLQATPENEDFAGKYENNGFIAKRLVHNYFRSVEILVNRIPENNKSLIAHEIGCGEGFSTKKLNQFKFKKLSASEYVQKLVPKSIKNNPTLNIFQESVYQLKYDSSKVDLVFLLEVLEHLDYPKQALKEISRISSNYLILGVPREPLWRILNMCRLKYLNKFGNTPGHLNHWSRKGIIEFVEKYFGEVIAVQSPLPWTILLAKKRNE
ncbi:class I SAM-dependent methyltransferase [Zunongwangia atlantica]|uniref:2-polyprenyl-3-methyl-5-hydroxy-6-metoxy-1, 4-benzoquinol methylase n=1 Tax=Zunongwangia atlantica 22II14-10F7 TaxID=1185767 RepID=A0A1Y1T1U3_9FLAO|nr:class I SAM-dependent methyltransferase [Zunongwangia atlantica]ORL44998.1 2-polyprenyl-3-methyl-5-hydroxy-6-metoxy-1,4-benzoquinol methylase [Zunongwangia atlantica 22II14-10F7]